MPMPRGSRHEQSRITLVADMSEDIRFSTGDRIALAAFVGGLAGTVAAMALPPAYPEASAWIWRFILWPSLLLLLGAIVFLIYDLAIRPRLSRQKLEPIHLIIFGLIGGWLLFGVAVAGTIWWLVRPPTDPTKAKVDSLVSDFDRYIKPRQLSDEQKNIIRDYLLPRGRERLTIVVAPQ